VQGQSQVLCELRCTHEDRIAESTDDEGVQGIVKGPDDRVNELSFSCILMTMKCTRKAVSEVCTVQGETIQRSMSCSKSTTGCVTKQMDNG
jgi:hypothetical protein